MSTGPQWRMVMSSIGQRLPSLPGSTRLRRFLIRRSYPSMLLAVLNQLEGAASFTDNVSLDNQQMKELAIWIVARQSDNPTLASAYETMRVTALIAEHDQITKLNRWLTANGDARTINYSLIMMLIARLKVMQKFSLLQSVLLCIVSLLLAMKLA